MTLLGDFEFSNKLLTKNKSRLVWLAFKNLSVSIVKQANISFT